MIDFAKKNAERRYKNGPELWNQLLGVVGERITPTCVIAGGAPRDFILGIEPKDIDVFVNVDRTHLEAWTDMVFDDFDMGLMTPAEVGSYTTDMDWDQDVMAALDGAWYPAKNDEKVGADAWQFTKKVQIIAHPLGDFLSLDEYADAIMKRMDIGLCQAVWKGGTTWGDIQTSPAFIDDKANKRITIIRQQSAVGIRASVSRVERFMTRFHDAGLDFAWRDQDLSSTPAENKP